MRYSLRREPRWNAERRARLARRAPHRKMRRMLISVCRRSASFIFLFPALFLGFGETGVANKETEAPPLFVPCPPRPSRFMWQGFATLGRRGAPRERCLLAISNI